MFLFAFVFPECCEDSCFYTGMKYFSIQLKLTRIHLFRIVFSVCDNFSTKHKFYWRCSAEITLSSLTGMR